MKYFKKEAAYGIEKTEVERVMTHYQVSREEAIAKIKKDGVEKLLPPRARRNQAF